MTIILDGKAVEFPLHEKEMRVPKPNDVPGAYWLLRYNNGRVTVCVVRTYPEGEA